MRMKLRYKGRVIDVRVYRVRDGGWTAHLSIQGHHRRGVLDTHFETGQRFPSCEAAVQAATRLGMHNIDTGFDMASSPLQQSATTVKRQMS